MTEKIIIPYFNIYASDFKAFKDKLTSDEFVQVIDAISDICLFGDTDFDTNNKFQMMFFLKLKESLLKNIPKYKSCIENGKKGGRPRKNKTQEKPTGFLQDNPDKTQPKPIKDNIIKDNIIENNIKKIDPYCNKYLDLTLKLSEKHLGFRPRLSSNENKKITELAIENEDFEEIIEKAILSLKKIKWDNIDFKPSLNWLLKENNFYRILNGEFDKKEEKEVNGWTLV